jgi:hypothetical protein
LTSLKRVVSEILFSRDFEVWEENGHLFGNKGDTNVVFCLLPEYDEEEAGRFLEELEDFKGSKIIATLESMPDNSRRLAEPRVFVWDREAIEHEIGRTRMESILGEEDHGLLDEISADDYPRMVSQEELDMMDVAEVGERIIRPVIDIDDVKEISRQTVGGFRHRLELVPHYVFEYRCRLEVNGEGMVSKGGVLSVNALTRKVESWQEDFETVFAIELNHRRMEPMIDVEDARNAARGEIIQLHTYERELIRDDGRVTVMEKKVVSPSPEDVTLAGKGIFYLPIWCVEGIHGVMIINAGTGKIISEDYYRD